MADRFVWHTGLTGEFLYNDSDVYAGTTIGAKAFWTDGDGRMEGRVQFTNDPSAPTPEGNDAWIYAADVVAGNCCMHFKSEMGDVVKLFGAVAIADAVTNHTIASYADAKAALDALGVVINSILALLRANGLLKV